MAKNILGYRECERFYLLRDTLAAFTHIELGLEGDFLYNPELMDDADDLDSFLANVEADADAPLFDEQAVAAALDAAFTDPDIIDRYIAANQTGFNASDLAVVESWKCALTDRFVVFKHAGKLLFLGSNRIFHVTGLVDPIADVLGAGGYPRIVTTALLPFGDKIVYSGFMYTMPLQFGSGMQSMLADEISRALKTGAHITRGEQLVELAPTIVDERIKREADLMMEELELDMKAEQQLSGHHKGVLADMDDNEREAAVRAHLREDLPTRTLFDPVKQLHRDCTKGPVRTDLASLISEQTKTMLQRQALLLGLPHDNSMKKAQLVEAIVEAFPESTSLPSIALSGLTPTQFDNYRALFDEGGTRRVPIDGVTTLAGHPPVFGYMCYLFEDGDDFVYVIPDETRAALTLVDWGACEAYVVDTQHAIDIADALTCLRGIVTFEDAYIEFKRCYPDAFGQGEFEAAVGSAIEEEYLACDIIDDGTTEYLVHFELGYMFRDENGIDEDDELDDIVLHGELGALGMLLQGQEGKVGRTLDEDMRTSSDIYDWRERRPAVRALRNYLDAHVPDSADDYYFADKVIEDLIEYMQAGFVSGDSVRTYFDILEDNGFVPDEAHMRKLLDLLINMANTMATWVNNGWAPNELHEAYTGNKVFYNDDGSIMKVGRNDPCPCGSGKKYKRCCGR